MQCLHLILSMSSENVFLVRTRQKVPQTSLTQLFTGSGPNVLKSLLLFYQWNIPAQNRKVLFFPYQHSQSTTPSHSLFSCLELLPIRYSNSCAPRHQHGHTQANIHTQIHTHTEPHKSSTQENKSVVILLSDTRK